MSTEKKITKRDRFNELLAIVKAQGNTDLEKFITHEIELLDKKNANRSNKPTATQKENNALKKNMVADMEIGKKYTITDMMKTLPTCMPLSNQKISALANQLVATGELTKTTEKGRSYFAVATETE